MILGLAGETPTSVDPDRSDAQIEEIRTTKRVSPPGHPAYRFDPADDLVLDKKTPLPGHANGMTFYAYDTDDHLVLRRVYYSIGGGFVVTDEELQRMKQSALQAGRGAGGALSLCQCGRDAVHGGRKRAVDRRDEARQRGNVDVAGRT